MTSWGNAAQEETLHQLSSFVSIPNQSFSFNKFNTIIYEGNLSILCVQKNPNNFSISESEVPTRITVVAYREIAITDTDSMSSCQTLSSVTPLL